jgi:lipopolysaccharide export system permease protein
MRLLHGYIRGTVIAMTGLVVLVIVGLQAFIGFINEIRDIGTSQYGAWQAFVYVIASLPHDVYPLFPAAALIGCLIGLGRLAAYSELIVMRASGVSKAQIALSVLRATILMLLVVTLLGEWLGPAMKTYASNYKVKAISGSEASLEKSGVWERDGDSFINIGQISADGQLHDIVRYQFSNQQLISASHADSGVYSNGHWVFQQVKSSIFQADRVIVEHAPQQEWPLSFNPKLISIINVDTSQASLHKLSRYIHYLHHSGLSSNAYEFDFWKRVFQPLATLVMIALGVPFIFGPLRTVTMGLRILIGVMIGFTFYTFNEFLGPFSLVYQVPPLWSAAAPVLLFLVIDGIVWWRVR